MGMYIKNVFAKNFNATMCVNLLSKHPDKVYILNPSNCDIWTNTWTQEIQSLT